MKYIARISYGKDSLKMLDVIFSRGLPLDEIQTSDVWATQTIRAEYPETVKFQERADEYIWKKYRFEVKHYCAMKDGKKLTYEELFYGVPKRAERNADRQGEIRGFPSLRKHWCETFLKRGHQSLPNEKQAKKDEEIRYIGIAADEPQRFGQLSEKTRAPLVEFGICEGLCGLYAAYSGLLSPTYENGNRDGCWFCHNQTLGRLRTLRKNHPELWTLLLKWDEDSSEPFKLSGRTVLDFENRFRREDRGEVDCTRRYYWEEHNSRRLFSINNTEFGNMLRQARKEKGLTLCDVAKLSGVSKSALSRYEKGAFGVNCKESLFLVAKTIGVNTEV